MGPLIAPFWGREILNLQQPSHTGKSHTWKFLATILQIATCENKIGLKINTSPRHTAGGLMYN